MRHGYRTPQGDFDPEEPDVFTPWTDEEITRHAQWIASAATPEAVAERAEDMLQTLRDEYAEQIEELEASCHSLAADLTVEFPYVAFDDPEF